MTERLQLTFAERAEESTSAVARRLFGLMSDKQSNLCAALDDTDASRLLGLADRLGPHIAVLKVHVDTIDNFDGKVTVELTNLAREHGFLIFEDRKFADIGQTVKNQYTKGIFHVIEWADIVNAHGLPGPGIIAGLKDRVVEHGLLDRRGLLLLAQMSSAGNLLDERYTDHVVKMAKAEPEFVIGFIGAGVARLPHLAAQCPPGFIIFSPGVKLDAKPETKGDAFGQRYSSPNDLMAAGADVIIVGRDIWQHEDPVARAQEYQQRGWEAYQSRISGPKVQAKTGQP